MGEARGLRHGRDRRRRSGRAAGVPLALGMAGLAVSALLAGPSAGAVATRPLTASASASAMEGYLEGVTCVGADDCVAVGGAVTRTGTENLAERWNGTKWSAMTPPLPAGSSGGGLSAVSCAGARSCIAVGQYDKGRFAGAEADRWNGSRWSAVPVALPRHSPLSALNAVACVSTRDCWASGQSGNLTLIDHWNGRKWSLATSPSPHPGRPNVLTGMACPTARACWAVGYTYLAGSDSNGSLTERWNGRKWAVVRTPIAQSGYLEGDACVSTSACLAVGASNPLPYLALAQRWTGSAWLATKVPVARGQQTGLQGVTCVSRADCVGVGYDQAKSTTSILAEKWNGSAWAAMKAKGPAGSSDATLDTAACTSASRCWAVGYYTGTGANNFVLIERWNGSSWSVG